jgi:carbon storage regulator
MLVLTRKLGETVVIGGGITLTVLELRNDSIRLGIDAPRNVDIHRGEVLAAVSAANLESLAKPGDEAALAALLGSAELS